MPKVMTNYRRERIYKVQEMLENGGKPIDIAEYFGISERMVYLDLKEVKKLNATMVEGLVPTETLGREIRFWLQLCRQAMRDYNFAQSENCKVGFLRVAAEARAKLDKLLQDSGLLNKVPERFSFETEIPFEDPEVRKAYLGFLKLARQKGEKNLGL